MLAPLAFFAAATALVLVVHRSLTADERRATSPATTNAAATGPRAAGRDETTTGARPRRRFYRIRSGDTLESIARRFDTTATELLELNPRIDPLALTPGQRIRVR